jgi:peroxiredoxin
VRSRAPRLRCLCVVAAGLLGACGSAATVDGTEPHVGPRVGDIAPRIAGTSIEGHDLSLSGWLGSVVVVVFWASWCTPCQAEQPAVDTLAREEMQSGVHFVGVSVDTDRSAAQSYVTRYTVPYDSLIDASQSLVIGFEVAGPPTTFVIGKAGRVAAQLIGEVDIATLRASIDEARSQA